MTRSSPPPSLKIPKFSEEGSSHPTIAWLSSRKNILLWALFALIALLFLTSRLLAMRTLHAENDFFQAEKAFMQLQQTVATPSTQHPPLVAELALLNTIMERHPELKPKYDGPLAQTLLIEGQAPQARLFAEAIFKRTQRDALKLYRDYAQASLLIADGRYTEALQSAEELKSALDMLSKQENPLLDGFNLIRLAMLYKQTGQIEQELKTWNTLESQPGHLQAFLEIAKLFKAGSISLNQYIEERRF